MQNAPLRVARPTNQLKPLVNMYAKGLGFKILGTFENHQGFDGILLGHPDMPYHFEFTHHHGTTVPPAPTQDNLLVFYLPLKEEWQQRCAAMTQAGFKSVKSYNPYWDMNGKTFEDIDGYRVVLQNTESPV